MGLTGLRRMGESVGSHPAERVTLHVLPACRVYFIAFKLALIWLVILISGATLLSALWTAKSKAAEVSAAQAQGITSLSTNARSLKWRAERNAWLAAFNLFAWFALWAYCSAVSRLNSALDRDDARAARAAGVRRANGDDDHEHQE